MSKTLEQKHKDALLKKQIAEARASTRWLNYLNANLQSTRKRRLGWTVPGKASRDLTPSDRRKAMAMARQRVEENPMASAIIRTLRDYIVGNGYRLIMRSGDSGWDTAVEDWWEGYRDKIEISGRDWMQLLSTALIRRNVDGDVGLLLAEDAYEEKALHYVQLVEADHIIRDARTIDDGVDEDEYGHPKRYWIHPDPSNKDAKPVAVDAVNFILYKRDDSYRAHRTRGYSIFLPVFSAMQDHADIVENLQQLVKNASFIGLKFKMEPREGGNPFGSASVSEGGVDYGGVKMQPGTNLVLDEGEDAEVLESRNPTDQVQAYERTLLSRICVACGLTYELLTGDYGQLNERQARIVQQQFARHVRSEQQLLGAVASRIFQWALSRERKYNGLNPPQSVERWWRHRWGMPGFPYINVKQEAEAHLMLLSSGLTSRTRILSERGDDDVDDILDELKYEQDQIQKKEVDVNEVKIKSNVGEDE